MHSVCLLDVKDTHNVMHYSLSLMLFANMRAIMLNVYVLK